MDSSTSFGLLLFFLLVLGLVIAGVYLLNNSGKKTDSQPQAIQASLATASKTPGVLMEAAGVGGRLQLLPNKIRIVRKGFLAFANLGMVGDKEIFIHQISSIQLKRPNALTNGFIQFAFMGGTENKGGMFDATKDENAIFFTAAQAPAFVSIKAAIEEQVAAGHAPTRPAVSAGDEIEKLASLRDRGILNEAEFQAKKKQLLAL